MNTKRYYSQAIWSIGQAAHYLRLHVETLEKWDRAGRLKAIRVAGNRMYRKEDILRFIEEHQDA